MVLSLKTTIFQKNVPLNFIYIYMYCPPKLQFFIKNVPLNFKICYIYLYSIIRLNYHFSKLPFLPFFIKSISRNVFLFFNKFLLLFPSNLQTLNSKFCWCHFFFQFYLSYLNLLIIRLNSAPL